MEVLEFDIELDEPETGSPAHCVSGEARKGVTFTHNLATWSLSDPASVCGYIGSADLANPMWYADASLIHRDKPGCTREQAQRAIEAHHAWLSQVILDPARLAEVRAMLALRVAREDVEQAERVLTLRRERVCDLEDALDAMRASVSSAAS